MGLNRTLEDFTLDPILPRNIIINTSWTESFFFGYLSKILFCSPVEVKTSSDARKIFA